MGTLSQAWSHTNNHIIPFSQPQQRSHELFQLNNKSHQNLLEIHMPPVEQFNCYQGYKAIHS